MLCNARGFMNKLSTSIKDEIVIYERVVNTYKRRKGDTSAKFLEQTLNFRKNSRKRCLTKSFTISFRRYVSLYFSSFASSEKTVCWLVVDMLRLLQIEHLTVIRTACYHWQRSEWNKVVTSAYKTSCKWGAPLIFSIIFTFNRRDWYCTIEWNRIQ